MDRGAEIAARAAWADETEKRARDGKLPNMATEHFMEAVRYATRRRGLDAIDDGYDLFVIPEPEHEPDHWPHTNGSGRWCVACDPIKKGERERARNPTSPEREALIDILDWTKGEPLMSGATV